MGLGCIGNGLTTVEFKCLPVVTIGGFEFEQYGKREMGVQVRLTEESKGGMPVSTREWFEREPFIYCVNVVCCQGVKEGRKEGRLKPWKECMGSCVVAGLFLLYPITSGKAIMGSLTSLHSNKLRNSIAEVRYN